MKSGPVPSPFPLSQLLLSGKLNPLCGGGNSRAAVEPASCSILFAAAAVAESAVSHDNGGRRRSERRLPVPRTRIVLTSYFEHTQSVL